MANKQSKILISVLVLIWSFIVSTAGFYAMSYLSDVFSFHTKWLLNSIFSTPPILAISLIGYLFKKKV